MGLVTQQDPIGIAGGFNLYGYANGDPINFSDPFGLFAEGACDDIEDGREWAKCKVAEYREEDRKERDEIARRAQFYEGAECVASGVAALGAVGADALFAITGYTLYKATAAAMTGPIWRSGMAWSAAMGNPADRAVAMGARAGSGFASENAGPPPVTASEFVTNMIAQSPRAISRAATACSR